MDKPHDYLCTCGKLLCKGTIFDGDIHIKCKRCGKIQTIEDGIIVANTTDENITDSE